MLMLDLVNRCKGYASSGSCAVRIEACVRNDVEDKVGTYPTVHARIPSITYGVELWSACEQRRSGITLSCQVARSTISEEADKEDSKMRDVAGN